MVLKAAMIAWSTRAVTHIVDVKADEENVATGDKAFCGAVLPYPPGVWSGFVIDCHRCIAKARRMGMKTTEDYNEILKRVVGVKVEGVA